MKKKLKVAYILLNELEGKVADTHQALNMVNALAKVSKLTFFSGWISKKSLKQNLRFYNIEKVNHTHRKAPTKLLLSMMGLEKISRGIFGIFVLISLWINRKDIIFSRDFGFIYFLSLLPKKWRPHGVVIFEPHTILHISSDKVRFEQENKGYQVVDYFCPTGLGIQKDLIEKFNVPKEKISVFPNGMNSQNFREIVPKPHFLKSLFPDFESESTIIYVGSFEKWKGVDTLVKSAVYFLKGIKLVMMGGKSSGLKRISDLVDQLGLNEIVEVMPYQPQHIAISAMKSAEIAVIPNINHQEGSLYTSPIKAFEYMSAGLPIVAADLPSLRNILTEGENCLFFQPGDEQSLSEQVMTLVRDKDLASNIRSNNLTRSRDTSWDHRAEKMVELFLEISTNH